MPAWFELAFRSLSAKVSLGSGTASPWTVTVTTVEAAPAGIVPVTVSGRAGLPAKSAELAGFVPVPESSAVKATAPSVPFERWTVKLKVVVPPWPSGRLTLSESGAKEISCVAPWGRAA